MTINLALFESWGGLQSLTERLGSIYGAAIGKCKAGSISCDLDFAMQLIGEIKIFIRTVILKNEGD